MWDAWHAVTGAADPILDGLTPNALHVPPTVDGRLGPQSIGTRLRRVTYHDWFHISEALAIRQLLGLTDLPEFVGDLHRLAPYRPELPA